MTAAVALLAGAFVAAWFVPGLLTRIDLRRRDPLLMIVAWLISIVGVLLAAAAGVLLLLLPSHGPGIAVLGVVNRCWSAIQHGSPPRVEEFAGLFGAALLGAVAVRVAILSVCAARWRARKRAENFATLRIAARAAGGPPDVLWLAHERPLAFSMAGRPGVVVATEGLTRHLRHDAVAAVVAHERAHLAGRHHVLIATTEALRTALPFIPLLRHAPRAIRDLVELTADVAAVRACGAAAVRSALFTVARHGTPATSPAGSLAMAANAVELRLARLHRHARPPGRARRAIACGLTGIAAAALPFLAATGVLVGIALIVCPPNG